MVLRVSMVKLILEIIALLVREPNLSRPLSTGFPNDTWK